MIIDINVCTIIAHQAYYFAMFTKFLSFTDILNIISWLKIMEMSFTYNHYK